MKKNNKILKIIWNARKKNIKDKKQKKKESNNRIEHNILSWIEKNT